MCKSLLSWLLTSNRMKHLIGIFILSLVGTALMGIGCAGGMEFKDVHHDNGNRPIREWDWKAWDWLDFLAGGIGAALATVIHGVIALAVVLIVRAC